MIQARSDVDPSDWDRFVDSSLHTWAWHRHQYLEARTRQQGIKDLSFAVCADNGTIHGIMPLCVDTNRHPIARLAKLPLNILSSNCEPVVRDNLAEKEQHAIFREMMNHLYVLGMKEKASEAQVFTEPLTYVELTNSRPSVNPLIKLGFTEDSRIVSILHLTEYPFQAWIDFKKRVKNDIIYAERQGVTTQPYYTPDDTDVLYSLHQKTYRRLLRKHQHLNLPIYPKEFFTAVLQSVSGIGVVAVQEGDPVALSIFVTHRNTAFYLWGFSSDEGIQARANAACQWAAIQWMCKHGIRYYEIGEIAPSIYDPHGVERGHPGFKSGFGGVPMTWYRGKMVLNPRMHKLRMIVMGGLT